MTIGPNMVVNGNFSNGLVAWANNGLQTFENVSGRLHGVGNAGSQFAYSNGSTISLVAGHQYVWSGDLEVISGTVAVGFNIACGFPATNRTAGHHSISVPFISTVTGATAKALVNCFNGAAAFFADNIEVKEILPMALASTGWEMTVNLADNGNGRSNLNYQLVAATAADAATAGATIRTRLALVTGMSIMGYTLTERFEDATAVLPGDDGVQKENRAKILCAVNGFANKVETVYIPAPVIGIFEDTTGESADRIDVTDADLISYIDIWRVTGALATLSDGEYIRDLAPIRSGNRTHRASSFG